MARLFIVSGSGAGGEHPLEGARTSIGRDPANTIVLDDSLVSKRHCEIVRDADGSLRIIDVGSSNGTLVNGRQVTEHRLAAGDSIQLGKSQFRFDGDSAAEEDEAARTVLIDDAATRLAIPAEAVDAARAAAPEAPESGASPESTIYISDDSAPAPPGQAPPAAEAPPPPAAATSRLPVMPILLCFIAVMIVIGIVLTWQVVRRSNGDSATEPAPAVDPAVAGGAAPEETMLLAGAAPAAGGAPQEMAAGVPVEEENLISEPVEPVVSPADQPGVDRPQGGQAAPAVTSPPAETRTTAPPPKKTYTPPPKRTSSPPVRPQEVPPSGSAATTNAAPATPAKQAPTVPPPPARPKEIVPDATHGVLHVLTKPVGATIYINEEMVGKTNSKKLMSPGKYIIRLEYQGRSVTDDVKVKEQEVSTFYHDFTPPPPRGGGKDDDDDDEDDEDEDDEDKDDDDEDDDDEDDDKKKKFKDRLKDLFG